MLQHTKKKKGRKDKYKQKVPCEELAHRPFKTNNMVQRAVTTVSMPKRAALRYRVIFLPRNVITQLSEISTEICAKAFITALAGEIRALSEGDRFTQVSPSAMIARATKAAVFRCLVHAP